METDTLVKQLAAGFEALQDEYQKLFGQQQSLERKLATAREQYNELAKLCDASDVATPPLSLSSTTAQESDSKATLSVSDILQQRYETASADAAGQILAAGKAALALRSGLPRPRDAASDGVKIWAGPSADRQDVGSSLMPSISESPLEQDFTIEGMPSRLGCPFASMANKKLSSHAASVLSRYHHGSAGAPSVSHSSVSRINGRESLSHRASRRPSIVDPIRAEICGMSEHVGPAVAAEEAQEASKPLSAEKDTTPEILTAEEMRQLNMAKAENAEPGVCPIRFLDQHSPEEVATYFERHKHELPRSHEVCVKRYQGDQTQVRELDQKYGNLVSMIQGLGAKHKDMLPEEPDADGEDEAEAEVAVDEAKVRKWASSVSPHARGEGAAPESEDEGDGGDDERRGHFERPLRDIRVGESPSRPWGIPVPAKYLEKADSAHSSPASPSRPEGDAKPRDLGPEDKPAIARPAAPPGQCPFGFDRAPPAPAPAATAAQAPKQMPAPPMKARASAADVPQSRPKVDNKQSEPEQAGRMVFTGPVFIGYNAEDAARILRASGMGERY